MDAIPIHLYIIVGAPFDRQQAVHRAAGTAGARSTEQSVHTHAAADQVGCDLQLTAQLHLPVAMEVAALVTGKGRRRRRSTTTTSRLSGSLLSWAVQAGLAGVLGCVSCRGAAMSAIGEGGCTHACLFYTPYTRSTQP